jgi:hypothetical protein
MALGSVTGKRASISFIKSNTTENTEEMHTELHGESLTLFL